MPRSLTFSIGPCLSIWIALQSFCAVSSAQTLHLITAADSLDKNVGQACGQDARKVTELFSNRIAAKRYTQKSIVAKDRTTLVDAIATIDSKPSDTVVLYFSGHGFHNSDGHKLFFSDSGEYIQRADLGDILQKKPGRLHVLITDCCNNYIPVPRGPVMMPAAPVIDPNFEPKTEPLFGCLFFECRGFLDITSSGLNEMSLTRNESEGSVFTNHFVSILRANEEKRATWKAVFPVIAAATKRESIEIYKVTPEANRRVKMPDGKYVSQTSHTPVILNSSKLIEPSIPSN